MTLKRTMLALATAALVGAAACEKPAPVANTAPAPPATRNGNDLARVTPNVVRDEDGPDNSHITVKQMENGQQVEMRTWASGPVKKVTRRVGHDNAKTIRVVTRDGQRIRVDDQNAVEHALDWTGAQIADAAKKLGKAAGAAADDADDVADEAGDKAEDAKDKTVGAAKKVGSEVGDKAEDVKDKTVEGAKKVGSEVGDKAEDVKDKTVEGAKKVGGKLKP